MTVRKCEKCSTEYHPEKQTEITQEIHETFGVHVCDTCIITEILPDQTLEGFRMQKEPA